MRPYLTVFFRQLTTTEEDREIGSQRCVAYESFSLLVPDNDLNLLELIILLLDESKHSRLHYTTFNYSSGNCPKLLFYSKSCRDTFSQISDQNLYSTPEEFEERNLFLWIGLPSTIIRPENEAFRKRSSNRRNLKTPCGRKTF